MMDRIRNIHVPSTAICFTLTILCASVLNLLDGYEYQSNRWIVEVFVYIVVMQIVDIALGKIEFKKYITYFVAETALGYLLLFGVFGYFGNWFSYTPGRIVQVAVMYLLICMYIHFYFYRRARNKADEINALLKELP